MCLVIPKIFKSLWRNLGINDGVFYIGMPHVALNSSCIMSLGRGVTYHCVKNQIPIIVVDIDPKARRVAESFGVQAIDPNDLDTLQQMLAKTDIVVTATGRKAILDPYPITWFKGKVLANMGVLDEYGSRFDPMDVLNKKLPINFILDDPTPIEYIDPELYVHNLAALSLLQNNLPPGVSDLSKTIDYEIIADWCHHHQHSVEQITKWFVKA